MNFKNFDQRNYRTVSPLDGYREWADTYEAAVPNQLDIRVLENLGTVRWISVKECIDLACGTGRIGQWLTSKGISRIDGIDITLEMLDRAREKNLYRHLYQGSVEETGIKTSGYDLIVMSLVDEHLPALDRVYREAHRLSAQGSQFVVVGMHPYFFMTGMPTHFKDSEGNPKAIETHIHLVSDHVKAAFAAGWSLQEMFEGVIDEEWLKVKPKWKQFESYPVNFGYVWRRL